MRRIFRICPRRCHSLPRLRRKTSLTCAPRAMPPRSREHRFWRGLCLCGYCIRHWRVFQKHSWTLQSDCECVFTAVLRLGVTCSSDSDRRWFGLQRDEAHARLFALCWSDQTVMRHESTFNTDVWEPFLLPSGGDMQQMSWENGLELDNMHSRNSSLLLFSDDKSCPLEKKNGTMS